MGEQLKIINIFGGPGCGKSTTAAGLYRIMKLVGMKVELVTEYAKDLTWQKRYDLLKRDQLYIFAKQNRRLDILRDQVEWVVTDSPILIGFEYMTPDFFGPSGTETFKKLLLEMWETYDNHNFFLDRAKPYVQSGRTQTGEEAWKIDYNIRKTLDKYDILFKAIKGDANASEKIFEELPVSLNEMNMKLSLDGQEDN